MVQKRDSGFSAVPLCLHSGYASGSLVAELLLKFLYNTGAGKSLLEIVYNRFRSFRFFLSIIPLFFFRRAALIVMSALRRPALSSLRLCVRFACGGVATGIPIQHERREIATGNRIQPVSSVPLFFVDHSAFFLSPGCSHRHVGFAAVRSVSTPVVRPVRLWRSCYRDSFTARAQENHFGG